MFRHKQNLTNLVEDQHTKETYVLFLQAQNERKIKLELENNSNSVSLSALRSRGVTIEEFNTTAKTYNLHKSQQDSGESGERQQNKTVLQKITSTLEPTVVASESYSKPLKI